MLAGNDTTTTIHPAFTLAEFAAITIWSAARPTGLRARVVRHHPDFPEAAEIYQRHPAAVLFLLHPTERDTVVLTQSSGGWQEFGSVEDALAGVLKLRG